MKQNMKTSSAFILTLSLVFCRFAECQRMYIGPNASWSEAFLHCRQKISGKLSTVTAEEWKERGVPSVLTVNDWVWVGALFLESHTWNPFRGEEADLWEYKGCYHVPDSPVTLSHKDVNGPHDCYERCSGSHRSPSRLYLFLKGKHCYCSPKLPEINFRVDPRKCDFLCHKSFHWCGGSDNFFSIYALADGLKVDKGIWGGPCFRGIFNDSVSDKWTLQIENSSCDANATTVCVSGDKTVSMFARSHFKRVSDVCKEKNSSLPLALCSNGSSAKELCDFDIYKPNVTSRSALLDSVFWLSLNRSESSYWIDGSPFIDENLRRSSSRCIAMGTRDNVTVRFKVAPCSASLPALCSYGNGAEERQAQKHTELAIIAGAGGVATLLAFVLLTVVMVCLKRYGKLRSGSARRTEVHQSTSRNSDITQSDQQCRSVRGQKSYTTTEVSDETTEMFTVKPAVSHDAARSKCPSQSEYGYVTDTDIGRLMLDNADCSTDGIYSECEEASMLPAIRAETTKGGRDRGSIWKDAADAEYTNVNSLNMHDACVRGQLPEVPTGLQNAESVDDYVPRNVPSRVPENESSAGTHVYGSLAHGGAVPPEPAVVVRKSLGAAPIELLYAKLQRKRQSENEVE